MQLYMRRYGSNSIAAGADSALLAWPVPSDCKLFFLKGECHLMIQSATVPGTQVAVYGAQGWLLKSEVTTDFDVMDTLWDKMVPKDNDVVDLDDSLVADTDSMFEPGSVSVPQLLDQEIHDPHRWYNRHKIVSWMSSFRGFSPTVTTHHPNDFFKFEIDKKYKMREHYGCLFGVGSPSMAGAGVDTDVIEGTSGTARDGFFVLKHMEDFLDKAMIEASAFTEAGAESPYEDIMNFLIDTLEEVNENTVLFEAGVWRVWAKGTAGIDTPGRLAHTALGPDSQA